jgi:zinc protease
MRTLYAVVLLGLFAGGTAGTAAAATKPSKADPVAASVKQWTLPNKLQVIYVPDHKAPVVTVQVFYHAGGKDEPADKRGIAHMFEHMMFKGSKHVRPEEHARFIDGVGGNENAFTNDDMTAYHNTIPPSALDFTLKLEAERMRNLLLIQKTIDSERQVVIEELRLRLENNPIAKALDKLRHLAFKVHPYAQEAIGKKEMLDTVTPADCQKFYDAYYQPNNALLIVAGDVDEKTVRSLVEKNFGSIPAGAEPPRPSQKLQEPPQTAGREALMAIPVQLPVIIGGYHIAPGNSEDIYPLQVLSSILSGGDSSRMNQRLVRKDHLAIAAGGVPFQLEDPGLFMIFAVFLPGSDAKKIRAELEEEVARVVTQPVDEKELAKAKNQLATQTAQERERVGDLATRIGMDWVVAHDPMRVFSADKKFDAVTAADVQRVAKKYLVPNNLSIVTLQPLGAKGGHK